MSDLFSNICGYNEIGKKNASKPALEEQNQEEFGDVDFTFFDETSIAEESAYDKSFESYQAMVEDYMYNYDLTEEEAEDYINKTINTEG